MTTPINIGSTKQLFLDDHVVDSLDNVVRQFHRPVRSPENPIIQADRPWERGGGGVYLFGGSVLYDEEDGHFKMWYRTSLPLKSSDIRRSQEPEGGYKACYAVSDDGVRWEKPSLGQTDFNGSKDNNILPPAIGGMQQIRRPNLIKDYEDPDPERRYKMIYMDNFEGKWALSKGYSRDGIAWRMNVGVPHVFESPVAPNGVLFGWDPRRSEYVHYHRKSGMVPADVDGRLVRKKHAVMRTASPDFETWGDTREVLTPSDTDPPNWSPSHGVDLAGVLYTDDLYVGTVDSGATYHVEDFPDRLWNPFHRHEFAEYRTELVISRDGVMWRRAAPFWEFMRSGSWGTWDRDHVGLAKPIIYNDEMFIYYAGSNVPMGSNAPGHPLANVINTVRDGQWMAHAIGLAKMRVDGFVSIDAYREGGTLTTKPLVFDGERLEVNVRAPERPFGVERTPPTPYGTLSVELLDRAGRTIEPFSAERCDTFTGDQLRHTLTWNGSPDVTALAGETVALRFHQRNAALYAFQFVRPGTRQSPANLLAPGAKGTP